MLYLSHVVAHIFKPSVLSTLMAAAWASMAWASMWNRCSFADTSAILLYDWWKQLFYYPSLVLPTFQKQWKTQFGLSIYTAI